MNLVSLTFFGILLTSSTYGDTTLSCPNHRPCRIALASHNPVTLQCEDRPVNAAVYWQYLDLSKPHTRPVTFRKSSGSVSQDENLNSQEQQKVLDLMSRSEIVSGNLKLLSPRIWDTGIYTCRDKGEYLAYYELDFQDSENIYVSHAALGHKVLPNTTMDLGPVGTAEVFTVWSSWQPCDRCGTPGERKKVGFCYLEIRKNSTVTEEPRPCGLLQLEQNHTKIDHAPELRVEMCYEACTTTITGGEEPAILLDNYHTYLHADALLQCPSSSIYRPVSWEHGNTSLTRRQQMMENPSYVLDKKTGGGTLFIPILNKSDEGIYRCYVERRMVGRYHVIFANTEDTSGPRNYFTPVSIVLGLSMFLVFLLVFGIIQQCKGGTSRHVVY